jgi:predicted metal-dependent phosphoesterase TrpH/ABC-type cobalamin/Fe3+-siderophores transport system ATPase subunit
MNTRNQKNLYPRGSQWRKWDLHVHTPASYDWDKSCSASAKDIVDKAIQEKLSVIAITDHHTIKGIDDVVKEANGKDLMVLPGVELRTDKGNKGIHIIGLFNSLISSKTIYDKLLCPLNLSEDDVKRKGNDQIYCNFEKACQKIHELGGLVLLHAGNKSSSIEQLDSDVRAVLKKDLAFLVDIFEVSNEKQVDDYRKIVFPKIKQEFPCIITSDACDRSKLKYKNGHSTEMIGKSFTWIKANPTFEGLKQIIYEPRDRVRIQENNPEPLKSSYSIDSLKISNGHINRNLSIDNVEIPINRNLVAVIGGKGSGKTALLDLIANCYSDKIDSSNKNSFVNRIFNEGQDLFTSVSFLNQENFSKKLVESKFITDSDIEYIPQGQIENKIGNTREFHNFLQNLIFKSDKVRNSTAYFEYYENEKNKKEIKQKIEELNQDIFTIETQIKNENIENINRQLKLKETEKTDIQEKINSVKILFTKEKLNEANKLQEELSVFKDRRDKLANLNRLAKSTLEGLTEIENLNRNIEIIRNLTEDLNLKDVTIGVIEYKTIKDQIENIQRKTTLELSTINKSIEQIQNKIEILEKDKKEYIVLLNKIKEIDDAINLLKNKQKNIEDLHNSLSKKIEKRWELYEQLINTYLLLRKKYKEIIEVFSKYAYEILSGIEFKASLIFDSKNFAKIGEDILDLRTFRESKVQKVSLLESEFLKDTINAIEEITKPESSDSKISNLTAIMKQKVDELLKIKKSTRTNEHLYEWFFGDYLSLNTETFFNETYLEKLSLGQKCTVLLKVYLAQGENTILIDQPDDNLDNEFIMNELVPAIRKAKLNRQVIIASNNANVVVNSDAEQIIVAEYKNGKISYIMGAIEEPMIKEKAIHILEGGPAAFEAREKKYDFK